MLRVFAAGDMEDESGAFGKVLPGVLEPSIGTFAYRERNKRRVRADAVEVGEWGKVVASFRVLGEDPGDGTGNDGVGHRCVYVFGCEVLEITGHDRIRT